MISSRLVLRLLDHVESCGVRQEIVGDLLEEMAGGRSPAWVYRQVIALCGLTLFDHVRKRAATPPGIAFMLGATGIVAISVVPPGKLIQAWLVLYYASGMASLFAHMAAADLPASTSEPVDD